MERNPMPGPETCEALLQTAVGINTVNAHISGNPHAELPLAEYLDALAGDFGLSTQRLPVNDKSFNLLVTHHVSATAPWLMFESHLDTVSVEGMTIDPFAARIENGRMYGRGACDTKASGAAMLWALRLYRDRPSPPNNIAILYTLDEEITKSGIRTFIEHQLETLDWKPRGVIVGEPTELLPVVAHNGVARWTLTTHGVAAHSADPSKGRSAISAMVKVINRLETDYIPSLAATHPLTGKAQASINVIRGGTQINIIPDTCTARMDRRVVPGEDIRAVTPELRRALDGLECDVHEDFLDPPLDPAGGESFIAFVQSVLGQLKLPDDPVGVAYATDASTCTPVGIPAVVLGPGNIAQAHTCDEWIALDQLHKSIDVYGALMQTPLEA
jgi:acetylornithine deacetylase